MARFCSGGWWAGSWRELLGACVPAGDGPSSVQPVLQPGQGCFYPEPPLATAPEIAAGLTAAVPVQPALRQEAPCVLRSQPLCSRWARAPGSGTRPCGAAGGWQPAGRTQGLRPACAGSGGCGGPALPGAVAAAWGLHGVPSCGLGHPKVLCSHPAPRPPGISGCSCGAGTLHQHPGGRAVPVGVALPHGGDGVWGTLFPGGCIGQGGAGKVP